MRGALVALALALAACRIPDVTFHSGGAGDDDAGTGPGGTATCPQLGYPSVPWLRLHSDSDTPAKAVAVGDINNDKIPDLAVLVGQTVELYLGNGDGSYHQIINLAVPMVGGLALNGASALRLAAIDAGTTLDLVIADTGNDRILVLLGNGDGTFQAPIATPTLQAPIAIDAADFTGDNNTDLVVASQTDSDRASVLLGMGNGMFTPGIAHVGGPQSPVIALGHVAETGAYDLVIGLAGTDKVAVLSYEAVNGFTQLANSPYTVPGVAQAVALGDVDGDGSADVIVATHDTAAATDVVAVLVSTAADFKLPVITAQVASQVVAVGVGDLQAGSTTVKDVIAISADATSGTAEAQVLFDDDGELTQHAGIGPYELGHQLMPSAGAFVTSLQIADLDRDGNMDFVLLNAAEDTLAVELGVGGGAFHAPLRLAADVGARTVAVGDLNGDTHNDLAVTTQNGVITYVQDASHALVMSGTVALPLPAVPYTVAIGPLDGSVGAGMIVGNQADLEPLSEILPADGGSFKAPTAPGGVASAVLALALADLSGDKIDDLVFATGTGDLYSAINDGMGGFSLAPAVHLGSAQITGLVLVDLNADHKLDVVAVDENGNIYSSLQVGTPSLFAAPATAERGGNVFAIAVGDVNEDKAPDAVAIDRISNRLIVVLNAGASLGTENDPAGPPTAAEPRGIALADVTGDGHLDAVVANSLGTTVSVFPGNGDGTFRSPLEYWVGNAPQGVTIADVNGDGMLDILVATQEPATAGQPGAGLVTVLYGGHLMSPSCAAPAP